MPFAVLALTCAAGCDDAKRQAQPRRELAARVEMPANTPPWVVSAARRMAVALEDPHPDRVRIRLGRDAIEMWGDFTCGLCGTGPAPGGDPRKVGTQSLASTLGPIARSASRSRLPRP